MDIFTENTVNLLLQIPLAAVVVFVVIKFLQHLKETTALFVTAQERQLVMFMASIKEQREQNIKSLKEVTDSIKILDDTIEDRLSEMEVSKAVSSSKRKGATK